MGTASKLRSVLLVASTCFAWLIFLSAAYADTPVVNPSEGTIGTTFTISGSDFGTKEGSVFIGSKPCHVLAWSDTNIECLIKVPMPPGEYDLVLRLHGKGSPLTLPNAFAIMGPSIDPPEFRPHFVSPGDVITIWGWFFGDGRGRHTVEIEDLQGDKRPCHILDWAMDSITFELPHGIPGIVHLHVTNAMGSDTQPWWGTFAQPPENPPNLLGSYTGVTSHDNASGVVYDNRLWAFYPHVNDDYNKIAYRRWNGKNWTDGYYLVTTEGVYQKSKAQINPLVADDILYVFYTGTNGKLYYLTYDSVESDYLTGLEVWLPEQIIPGAAVEDVSGRFAAVYNFTKKWIEIYWTPDSVDVYMKTYSLDTNTWSETSTVVIPKPVNPTIAPYLTAVFNQVGEDDYVTYLSWADGYAGYLAELKDGAVLRYATMTLWQPENTHRGPSLADLGDDYLAVILNKYGCEARYMKYDKNLHMNVSPGLMPTPFMSPQDSSWAPTGITFSTKVADSTSPTGDRMNSNFYVFTPNNPIFGDTKWEFVQCEFLGYWMPTDAEGTDVDFNGSDMLTDTFELWPIIGVIDMPPYVENGHGPCGLAEWEKCGTEVEFSFEKVTTAETSAEYSAGPYMRSRARSHKEFEASAGYAGGFENSKTYKYSHTDTLDAGREGAIVVYYFAPKFKVWNLEWYDLTDTPTGLFIPSVEVAGAEFRKEVFPPHEGPVMSTLPEPYLDPAVFPYHGSEDGLERPEMDTDRLLTYWKDPTDYGFKSVADPFLSSGTWDPESGCGFTTGITEENSIDNGFYVDFKIGAKMGVAFGGEGSFKMMFKTKTEKSVEALTTIRGPMTYDADPYRILEFHLEGYWLKPDTDGYWIPEYRKKMGDRPWFITYRVTDGWLQGTGTPIPFYPPFPPQF